MIEGKKIVVNISKRMVNEPYRDFVFSKPTHRRYFIYGGSGSGKSYAVAQHLLINCLREEYFRCIYMRKVARTIRNSIYLLFKDLIKSYKLNDLFECMDTTMDIHCINGNSLIAAGMDDAEKIKSIQEPNCFWLEEATEFEKEDYGQMILRCRTKKAFNYSICTFNPISKKHWTYNEVRTPSDNSKVIFTTFVNNSFVSNEYKEDVEKMKDISEDMYRVYALGEWGEGNDALVFNKYDLTDKDFSFDCIGIDFGYTNPTAIVAVKIDNDRKEVYVKELMYKPKSSMLDIYRCLRDYKVGQTPIFADSEDAFKINEIYKEGFNVFSAKKDVYNGLLMLKEFKIYVHRNSINLIKEMDGYSHAKDKYGNVVESAVIKNNDHAVDALRYAVYNYVRMNQMKTIIV